MWIFCYSAYSASSYNLSSVFQSSHQPWASQKLLPKRLKDEEIEDSTRKDLNAMLNGLKYRRGKKGETNASKILEVGPHKNKSILSILTDLTPFEGLAINKHTYI